MRKGFLFVLVAIMLSACLKRQNYPDRPYIEFLGFYPNIQAQSSGDSLGFVKFRFTDGDGDLGLGQGDTLGEFASGQPYHYNLFIYYYEKQNGTYVRVDPPETPFHVRFKRLTATGGNGALEGTMDVGVYGRPGIPWDTIRYEMFIVDRALHISDTIVTPDILLSQYNF
ncbi:MAG: hypothetical protein GC178_16510 [Flavobacteriales bacterium]|nr:hypothetical protein [Flavobacteriales bacterium]